jgi:hypothetical protein
MTSENLSKTIKQLQKLDKKYENDSFMHDRLHSYIQNNLPNIMKNIKTSNDERISRNNALTFEFHTFIRKYLNENKYFYVSATDKFYVYDGVNYKVTNEDYILHNILTTITKERSLLTWKYKTKVTLMKTIKENSLFDNVPESVTIQTVINSLYPSLFPTKYAAQYFITVLGDNLLKKNNMHIHYVPLYSKAFIRELNNLSQCVIGHSNTNTFKMKYHEDHDYNFCRIINLHETVKYENIWKRIITENGIDLICVSLHYSNRFGDADAFMVAQSENFENHIHYLKNNSKNNIINTFVDEYFTEITDDTRNTTTTEWKDIYFLWKHFLNKHRLPNIMYQSQFYNLFSSKLTQNFNTTNNNFTGLFSKFLPSAQSFVAFWNETMIEDPYEHFMEIDEIRKIFKFWNKTNDHLSNQQILDIISYFFPDVCTENEKHIHEFSCSLWNKGEQIENIIGLYKKYYTDNSLDGDKTIHDAYVFYCNFLNTTTHDSVYNSLVVDKSYFQMYLIKLLSPYIDNNYISSIWFNE